MVIFFKRKDSDMINMLVKVANKYNLDGSSLYFSGSAISLLVSEGKWIIEHE